MTQQKEENDPYRVPHVGLKIKSGWWAEDVVVGLHQFLLVPVGLQALCRSVQCFQTRVFRRLYVLLCGQVGPQGSMQAGMVAQVAALSHVHADKDKYLE